METITSRENAGIKEYCKLTAAKKQRDAAGKFAAEGVRLTLEAFQNGVRIEKVFFTAGAEKRYGEKLFELLNSGIPASLITEELSSRMSDTDSPQGVFAICKKLDKSFGTDKIEHNSVYAALSDLQDPGNMGTIIRTAEALGVRGIIASEGCCDLYNPKVLRATMGAAFRMPYCVVPELGTILRELSGRGILSYAAVLDEAAEPLTEIDFSGGGIAVIGNEGNGLKQEVSAACDRRITIRMKGKAESLNAAMAAGIILWEMTR